MTGSFFLEIRNSGKIILTGYHYKTPEIQIPEIIQCPSVTSIQGGASWWTTEEENDCISMKKKINLHKKYVVIFSESVFAWLLH